MSARGRRPFNNGLQDAMYAKAAAGTTNTYRQEEQEGGSGRGQLYWSRAQRKFFWSKKTLLVTCSERGVVRGPANVRVVSISCEPHAV